MHYLIDGYNLLFRSVDVDKRSLQSSRIAMVRNINEHVADLGLDVTVIFDSKVNSSEISRGHYDHLQIIFTYSGVSADDYILQWVERSPRPNFETVVTSDKDLALKARHLGAKTVPISTFVQWLNKKGAKQKKKSFEFRPIAIKQPPKEVLILEPTIPDGSFDYYLKQFEARLPNEELPKISKKPGTKKPKRLKKDLFSLDEKVDPYRGMTEEQRWLKIFEERDQ
jgi:predicted RNA-binding protein with PIN domain